ncbi:MAG: hypothetical protein AWU57_2165 [Marinobacter sp. T13-3]|nr:MAG: hypothetical protein AWU57_2165 [Marinobacter sp. T13-3]
MMMKWLIRLAFPALGLLLVLIFFGIGNPGQVSVPTFVGMDSDIPAFEQLIPEPVDTEGPEIIFKWQDIEGNWHYADTPPADGKWNALAIEGREAGQREDRPGAPNTDWQAPYRAPFSLDDQPVKNES